MPQHLIASAAPQGVPQAQPHDPAQDDDPSLASSNTSFRVLFRPCHMPPHVCGQLSQLSRRTLVNVPVCIGHRFARTWVETRRCLHGDAQWSAIALYTGCVCFLGRFRW
eukprot:4474263-Amphidinium_carterae.2